MVELLQANEIETDQWEQLVETSPVASFFQTPECYQFYASLTFLKPFLYGVAEDGKLKGIACGYVQAEGGKLKQFFSRRAIIPGGILLDKDIEPGSITALLEFLKKELHKRAIYIECRNFNDYSEYRPYFEKVGFIYQAHLNVIINTSDKKSFHQNISKSKKRQLKKSKEAGIIIKETKEKNEIKEFYKILLKLYKQEIKKPLFREEFFEKIVNLPDGHLFIAKLNEKVIGGIVCVSFRRKVFYEWYICGNKDLYNHLYPSTALTFTAIEYALENGYEKFDFMGAGKPNEIYGVRQFKEKFGGETVEYGRFLYVNNKRLYFLGENVIKFLSKF